VIKRGDVNALVCFVSDRRVYGNAYIQKKEHAIAAAREFIDRGYRDALEVGPMSENPDGKVLDERDLSQRWEKALGAATPVPFARGGIEDKLKNLTTGAAVTFEINPDNWRIMEYLISRSAD
jgi:hypothetical protein